MNCGVEPVQVIAVDAYSRYTRTMFTISLYLVSMAAFPFIAWRKYRTSSSLFVSATGVCALYVLAMASIHGLSNTFPWGQTQTTLIFWPDYVRWVASLAIPAIILLLMERWNATPNRWFTFAIFWAYNLSIAAGLAAGHIYSGYQYPPVGLETLGPAQLQQIGQVIYFSNIGYFLSLGVFFGLIAWSLALKTPSAWRALLTTIRG